MKKAVLLLVLAVFCMQVSCIALGSEAPENLMTYEMPETGFLPGAAMTREGVLLTGVPLDREVPWVLLLDENYAQRWAFSEPGENVDQYLCPAFMDDGTYAVLRQSYSEDTGYDCARLNLDANGKLLWENPLWPGTQWMIPFTDKTYAIGYFIDDNGQYPMVSLYSGAGDVRFSYTYTLEGFSSVEFEKGYMTDDALIISGHAIDAQFDRSAGLLYRIDPAGKVVWALASTADDPSEFVYANDLCVTEDGLIIWVFTTVKGDEDDDFPIERTSTVLCVNMDGETQWTYETSADDMLDYVLPAPGGFLLGSRGLDLENCPYLGEGWLLYLTRDGQAKPDMVLPQLNDGSMDLLGMTEQSEYFVVCYGLLLESPGFPDKPFLFELALPRADE